MAFRGARATAVLLAAVLLSFPLVPAATEASAFTDSFDRDDSPDVGNGWLEVSGALSISGMVLRSAPIRQLRQLAIVSTLSSARQTVAASFATGTTNNSPRFLLVLRYQNPQNYYLVSRRSGGTNAVQISKVFNGTETVLATTSPPKLVMNTFFRLEGQVNGATLTLALDGVPMLSAADSTFAAGNVGIGLDSLTNPSGQSHRAANFAASTSPTLALGATPGNVALNGSSTLSWSTAGATACSFTSGLIGPRPLTGSEPTGALASTTSFAMTCTGSGSGGSVAKSVTVTVGDPPPPPPLPTAAEVYTSQAMVLPGSVRAFVILVPNEAHDTNVRHRITPNNNGHMLPAEVTLPAGASVSVLNADHGHEHLLNVWSGTAPIFTTGKLRWEQLSAPARLDPGSYTLVDWKIPFILGGITIGEEQTVGTLLVGAFFLPANLLASYRTLFAANGFRIESEHMFTHERRNEVLVIFSTEEEIATAGPRLQALVRANTVYD